MQREVRKKVIYLQITPEGLKQESDISFSILQMTLCDPGRVLGVNLIGSHRQCFLRKTAFDYSNDQSKNTQDLPGCYSMTPEGLEPST